VIVLGKVVLPALAKGTIGTTASVGPLPWTELRRPGAAESRLVSTRLQHERKQRNGYQKARTIVSSRVRNCFDKGLVCTGSTISGGSGCDGM
jgi:hypothetical protein